MIKIAVITAADLIMEPISPTVGVHQCDGKRKPHGLIRASLKPAAACIAALFLAGCAVQPHVAVKDTSRTFTTVVIDPGHGGKDSGTFSKGRKGPLVLEKVAALDVGLRLNEKLRAAGFQTVMTRRSDVFIPLDDRARISNRQTNAVYVSIHFNDSPRRKIHGIETYYNSTPSIGLAERIERHLDTVSKGEDRGVKYANFRVLRLNQYPAVLIECGFLSNKNEAVRAASPQYRENLADRIADAIYEQRFGSGDRLHHAVKIAPAASSDAPVAPASNQ